MRVRVRVRVLVRVRARALQEAMIALANEEYSLVSTRPKLDLHDKTVTVRAPCSCCPRSRGVLDARELKSTSGAHAKRSGA